MAGELHGMVGGNVSSVTGENVKPAYGGTEDAFLTKVVRPIYNVIAAVRTSTKGNIFSSCKGPCMKMKALYDKVSQAR